MSEELFFIKVLRPGRRRWEFLAVSGTATHLQLYAMKVPIRSARGIQSQIAELDAGIQTRIVSAWKQSKSHQAREEA